MGSRPSLPTHGYYRGYLLPAMADYMGYESTEECHEDLLVAFFRLQPGDPVPSMGAMPQERAGRFIDWVLRKAAEGGLILNDPERKR